ncbi:unnamed protein product [Spirodela intermedia]|uniref:Uncharacterized protein n=1 Tax=Spirodela intermedia TaxID=51605 RepID=A0A7I8L9V9_SPIIN|nr:unnamed protein product [Spirodela intermedia]
MPASAAETPSPLRHIHVESIQSVTPREMVPPGKARRIGGTAALGSYFRTVLYYRRADELEDAWSVSAHLKESLSAALVVDPLIAGRIRRRDDGDGGGLEVRLNDAGLRLVQAKADFTMTDLLASPEREVVEAHLAHWVGVDEEKPQFSALFFIQVTGFLDDGISIGLCCSLFLADPLLLSNFLHKWAQIHATMHAQKQFVSAGIFNLGAFRRPGRSKYLKSTAIATGGGGSAPRTVLFDGGDATNAAAFVEAARRVGERPEEAVPAGFSLIITEADRMAELKVVECSAKEEEEAPPPSGGVSKGFSNFVGDWLRGGELGLTKGNKPVMVSWHLVPATDRPLVVVMPAVDGGGRAMVSVTFPKKEE